MSSNVGATISTIVLILQIALCTAGESCSESTLPPYPTEALPNRALPQNATKTLFVRATGSVGLKTIDQEALVAYMEQFGTVKDAWIPQDKRNFGFITFGDLVASSRAVAASPHTIGPAQITSDFRKPSSPAIETTISGSRLVDGKRGDGDRVGDEFLEPMPIEDQLAWEDYKAPVALKETLKHIADEVDPSYAERLQAAREKQFGDAGRKAPGIPIVLFYGPPGTGKTFAMQILASQSKRQPWLLKTKGLQERAWVAEALFGSILERIADLDQAIVFIDEAEVLFPKREVMAQYASVDVRAHQKMLVTFLQWAQGLQTRNYTGGRTPPLVCLGTNLPDEMDTAVLDRVGTKVAFGLPTINQCTEWWRGHARQLTDLHVTWLGWASVALQLSFRGMWSIADAMIRRDAAQEPGSPSERLGEPSVWEYLWEMFCQKRQQLPTCFEVLWQIQRWLCYSLVAASSLLIRDWVRSMWTSRGHMNRSSRAVLNSGAGN